MGVAWLAFEKNKRSIMASYKCGSGDNGHVTWLHWFGIQATNFWENKYTCIFGRLGANINNLIEVDSVLDTVAVVSMVTF